MNEEVYAIWCGQALGYGNHRIKDIIDLHGSFKEFYEAGEYGWRLCGCFDNKQIETFRTTLLDEAYSIFRRCEKFGYKVLSILDERYPNLLREISDPPVVIYTFGNESCLKNDRKISIVGAREATPYGEKMARQIAFECAGKGALIVSGGALGIDAAAHLGALEAGKSTICVLGCGINTPYLLVNQKLREKISKSGLLLSEFPPDFPAYPRNFPKRNRIIAGLSLATIVVEAGRKSGSLITANLANNQNRDVFVAPVDLKNPSSEGIISLINDGAKVLSNVTDLIRMYDIKFGKKVSSDENTKKKENFDFEEKKESQSENLKNSMPEISGTAGKIYSLLETRKMSANEICEKLGINIREILVALTELEICGLIKNATGKDYEKI